MELKEIKIDLEVYKAIENLRRSFSESQNDILRRVFLGKKTYDKQAQADRGGLQVRDGVYLKAGTSLRHIAKRTGQRYDAVVEDGGIRFSGKLYHSPSHAAVAAAGNSRNGWIYWEYFDEETAQWSKLDNLRQ